MRRLTIGLATANIHVGVGATLWSGVLRAAERNDVNLVCFPGGPLRPGGARGALYDLIGPARLDGVVCWSSTLGLPAPGARRPAGAGAQPLPVVSVNRVLDGHETLTLDSHAAMREAVGHLVARHGRRRLACIRGPLTNPVSLERYRAYTDALAWYRLPLERSLVCAAVDFGAGAGASAMRVMLDARGLTPAPTSTRWSRAATCWPPTRCGCWPTAGAGPGGPVGGRLQRLARGRVSDPPLTSVSLPFAELGALAVDTLVARLRGTPPRTVRRCPARWWCGARAAATPAGGTGRPDPVAAAGPPAEVFADVPYAGPDLAAAFAADAGSPAAEAPGAGDFLPLLERLLGRRAASAGDRRRLRRTWRGGTGRCWRPADRPSPPCPRTGGRAVSGCSPRPG
ncbi:substrate-binding domain-containing protein [Streptomyces sp. M19]